MGLEPGKRDLHMKPEQMTEALEQVAAQVGVRVRYETMTGDTAESGFGLVGSAVQNGQRLIVVVNGLKTAADRAEESRKLLESVRADLHNRRQGDAVRMEIESEADPEIIERLGTVFELDRWQVFPVNGPVNLSRLFNIYDEAARPDLKFRTFVPRELRLTAKSRIAGHGRARALPGYSAPARRRRGAAECRGKARA